LVSCSSLLESFARKMVLLHDTYMEMNGTHPVDSVAAAMQAGTQIGYRPERAGAELEAFPTNLASSQIALEKNLRNWHTPMRTL